MTFRAGKLSAVAIDKLNASPFLNSADWTSALGTAEVTHMGSQGKEFIAGLSDGSVTMAGMFDALNTVQNPTGLSADAFFDSMIGAVNDYPITLFFDGGYAVGRRCQIVIGKSTSYDTSSPVGGVTAIKYGAQVNGRSNDGFCLTDGVALTTAAAANYGSVDNGTLVTSTPNGLTGTIHVFANTWTGTTSVKIQHSTDNSVWVDFATQTVPAATQAGYIINASGTLNRYVRAQITPATGSGSISVLVAFARN